VVLAAKMEDLLLNLDRRSIGMPLRNRRPVRQTGVVVLPIGVTSPVETVAADAKISTGLCDVTRLFGVLKNTKLACDFALIPAHEHLLHPRIGSLLEMSREYRHIYRSRYLDDEKRLNESPVK